MAGHSHAANIARRKGAQDIKRGKVFTKIAREIIVAAKGGPDINFNAKLRAVVVKARKEGMAKDRIDAAIDMLADKLDRLLIKQKEKMTDHHRGESAARSDSFG